MARSAQARQPGRTRPAIPDVVLADSFGRIATDLRVSVTDRCKVLRRIAYPESIYTWTNVIPDTSTWPHGDRGLHCVAYYATAKDQAGAVLTRSIKGSRRWRERN